LAGIDWALVDALEGRYGAHAPTLHLLADLPEKRVYRVDLEGQPAWVVRAYAPTSNRKTAMDLAAILSFLEQRGYPAERVVRGTDGSELLITVDGWQVLVTTFIGGTATDFSASSLRRLGSALGRLHALDPRAPDGMARPLPRAEMLPANELRWAAARLANVESRVPGTLRPRYDALASAIREAHRSEDLPVVVTHNDCHPANSVVTPDGAVVLYDWEGAGLGPAVIDVGFLVASCEIPHLSTTPLGPDRGRVAAVVDGYSEHHRLTHQDLERLPDAIRFRALVAGAASLASLIAEGRADDAPSWWWHRYVAADEIAARTARRFQRYL
jgi:Ser/Thr protein kinase RdoA (MazF antagonist)